MTVADNVRAIASEAEPLIEQWLEAADQLAGLRDVAKDKGINWSALKAILVAKVKDNNDGGDRVAKMAEKFDEALTYAGMLTPANRGETKNVTPQSSAPSLEGGRAGHSPMRAGRDDNAPSKEEAASDGEPAVVGASAQGQREPAGDVGLPAGSPPTDSLDDIPGFLRRGPFEARTQ